MNTTDVNIKRTIIGVDPGFAILGWGIIQGVDASKVDNVEWGAITTKAHDNIEERLLKIYNELNEIIDLYKPQEISLEKVFFNSNAKTVISVGQSQGIVLLIAAQRNIPIYQYTPLQVKSALTGYGVADKKQIQNMLKLLLRLSDVPKPDDAADGVALALCHMQTQRGLS
jgi:crossover junction endodeoxyribonuclease RuvC